jgi:glutamate racemase
MDNRPIGLFDSGVGGLTIWRAVHRLLPQESLVYAADQAYFPYADRGEEELQRRAEAVSGRLIQLGAKLVVVACNTASVGALAHVRRVFPETPFVGVVPVIKTLARVTRTGKIALLCTPSTAKSAYIQMLAAEFAAGKKLRIVPCPRLETLLEEGAFRAPETRRLLEDLLTPLAAGGVDAIGLGCTHYPLVRPLIKRILGSRVRVYEPSRPVARRVRQLLTHMSALAENESPRFDFRTTGRPERLQVIIDRVLRLPGAQAERL